MSTALSWTDTRARLTDPVSDLRALLRFRSSGLGAAGRRKMRIAGAAVLVLTLFAIVVPGFYPGARTSDSARTILAVMPTVYLGFLVLTVVSASASGGGREVIPRDQAVTWPITSTTDHLGALLLAPLNIAWLLQAWTLLGTTAYVSGPENLWATESPVLVYLLLCTALAQVVAWTLEFLRRGPHGRLVTRSITGVLAVGVTALVLTHRLTALLDHSPTIRVLIIALNGIAPGVTNYWVPTLGLLLLASVAVLAGAVPARWAAQRAPRDEHRMETGTYQPRPDPVGDLRAMIRIDRAGVWRSLPLRRGLMVLAVLPGVIAFAGHLPWTRLTILPGLVASGAALLFGVNAWCLDGRGGLWRQSLPVGQGVAFASRVWVITEVLLGTALLTVLLGASRAGIPTTPELVAMVGATAVVTAQVVSASMRWSVRRPFAVDMRSSRATPAPPVVMVGYSTRLALGTTFVGLIFSSLAEVRDWHLTALIALLLVLVSAYRIARTARRWEDPEVRARVVVTVAG